MTSTPITTPTTTITPPTNAVQLNADDTSNDASEIATSSELTTSERPPIRNQSTFDYLYEFSETRKVLEEFFKCPGNEDKMMENGSDTDSIVREYFSFYFLENSVLFN